VFTIEHDLGLPRVKRYPYMMSPAQFGCQCCGRQNLHEITGFSALPRVTSDCKPFRPGGRLFACEACGAIQKIPDSSWLRETDEIYRDYQIFHQSSAIDQAVFDPASGHSRERCAILAQRLQESGLLPGSGTLLDVGAGSGAMLAAFSARCQGWRLFGLDLDDRKQHALKTIPRFERLYTTPPEQLTGNFDLVTLVHSLEHFPNPGAILRTLSGKLTTDGRLFVQVPNIEKSPFDLVVADHLCHLSPQSLSLMLPRFGFRIDRITTDWVGKEISLLGSAAAQNGGVPVETGARDSIREVERTVVWLKRFLDHAREVAIGGRFGIFGTSISATWLAAGLEEAVEFFVDEDPAREGRTHLGRPILKPAEAPADALVYLAFADEVADAISRRLQMLPATFIPPPMAAA
jgi:SAM-dependent methyltransferase